MTNLALLALILLTIEGLIVLALVVEGVRRHLAGVHLEQQLHQGSGRAG